MRGFLSLQPPKSSKSKKVAKAKASAVVDCLSTEEMSKEQVGAGRMLPLA